MSHSLRHVPVHMLLVTVACSFGSSGFDLAHADESVHKMDTAEIKTVFNEFDAAFRHLDWQRLRGTFAKDATMFSPSPSVPKRLNGIAEIERVMKPMFETNRELRAAKGSKTPKAKSASVIGLEIQNLGETAIVTFQSEFTFGHVKRSLTRRTLVVRKNAGKWLIVHLHGSNTDLPEENR